MLSFTKNLTGQGYRQTKTIMPPAIGSHAHLARRALVYSFSPFSAKRNKKIFLCELCASNERSEWAVKKYNTLPYLRMNVLSGQLLRFYQ
jgi:hypothetical protein